MGVGLGHAIAACVVHPDRPVIHLSGDSAIGFSGMEMETLVRYNFPAKIVVLNNGGIGPGMPEIPESPMFQHEAQRTDLRRAVRQGHGGIWRQGLLCRRPEGSSRRPRRGDELPRPRPR